MNQDNAPQRLRDAMYGEQDLGSFSLFSGGFINYGFWRHLKSDQPITEAERTDSQAELYRQVVSRLRVTGTDRLLELGCGVGAGAALVAQEFAPERLHCLDRSPEQLERAQQTTAGLRQRYPHRLSFHQGSATALPWSAELFHGVFSVEALQHVDDVTTVATEAHRVMLPGARLAVATFFAPDGVSDSRLPELLDTVGSGVDVVRPVSEFATALNDAGFTEVRTTSLGEHVWEGLDRWIAQTEYADSWGRNWLEAWRRGWVDYYLLTARKARG